MRAQYETEGWDTGCDVINLQNHGRKKKFAARSVAHRSESHRLRYIDASRRASSVISRAKSATLQATCSNLSPHSDPRAVFRLLNAISGKKNTSHDPSFPDCTSPLDTANHYASYLRSHLSQATPRSSRGAERQFMNELRKASCEDASSLHNSFCSPFSLNELSTAISNLSASTASGPDQIAYSLLKHLPEPAQLLLLSLFNRSWHSHTFPSCWKPSTIIPIHKPGKPTSSPSSFRPISLTSCISKLFERLILSRLTFHLESNHLLSTCQAGFRPGRSSLDQILTLSQSIWDGFQKKKPPDRTILASVDFSKAFDSVWHSALFHKLLSLKLPACFVLWVRSFLSDRRAKVQVGGSHSRPSASDVGSHRDRFLVQSFSFCLLMTSLRIYLGMPMPPCMLTIWLSGPLPQTCSKPPLLSNPPSPSLKHGPTYGDFHSIQRSVSPPFSLQIPIKPLSNPD